MYSLDVDAIYVCGDLNSRIADREDSIENVDIIPERVAIVSPSTARAHRYCVNSPIKDLKKLKDAYLWNSATKSYKTAHQRALQDQNSTVNRTGRLSTESSSAFAPDH